MSGIVKAVKDKLQGKTPSLKRRSKDWPKVRALHLKEQPRCQVCSGNKLIEVHHVVPFHANPSLELEPSNLITLCESKKNGINCHLFAGHLGNYKRANPSIMLDAFMLACKFFNKTK